MSAVLLAVSLVATDQQLPQIPSVRTISSRGRTYSMFGVDRHEPGFQFLATTPHGVVRFETFASIDQALDAVVSDVAERAALDQIAAGGR